MNKSTRDKYAKSRAKALSVGAKSSPTRGDEGMVAPGDWGDLSYLDGVAVGDSRAAQWLKRTGQKPNVPNPLLGTRK